MSNIPAYGGLKFQVTAITNTPCEETYLVEMRCYKKGSGTISIPFGYKPQFSQGDILTFNQILTESPTP